MFLALIFIHNFRGVHASTRASEAVQALIKKTGRAKGDARAKGDRGQKGTAGKRGPRAKGDVVHKSTIV